MLTVLQSKSSIFMSHIVVPYGIMVGKTRLTTLRYPLLIIRVAVVWLLNQQLLYITRVFDWSASHQKKISIKTMFFSRTIQLRCHSKKSLKGNQKTYIEGQTIQWSK